MSFKASAEEFLAQDRIAIAGVSATKPDATANYIYNKLRETGHSVIAVNPNATDIDGDPCYPNMQAIPDGVDGAVIVTRPELTEQIAHDCVEAGIPRVWMHNNTFMPSSVSETGAQYCRDNNITVIEGGCPMMFLDFGHKCMRLVLGVMNRLPA